jgi:hypothetical protein
MQRSTPPPRLRVIDGGKREHGITVTEAADRGALRNGTAPRLHARHPFDAADPDDRGVACHLDREVDGNRPCDDEPQQAHEEKDRNDDKRNRSPWSKCDPRREHFTFADEVIPFIPRTGVMLFVGISLRVGQQLGRLHRELRRVLDDHDCDSFIVEDWGKHTCHPHVHAVIHVHEPPKAFAILHPLLFAYGVGPETFDMQVLYGWKDYRSGRSDKKIARDLPNLAWYCTRPPDGDHARLPHVHTSARGIFFGPWRRLMRATGVMTRIPACEACGLPLPSKRRSTRRVCVGERCRQQKYRDNGKRKVRTLRRWHPSATSARFARMLRQMAGDNV